MTPDELFRSIDGSVVPTMADVQAKYRIVVEDKGTWILGIDRGVLRPVKAGDDDVEVDCGIILRESDLYAIHTGEKNLFTAALRGDVTLSGDALLLRKFHGALRERAHARMQAEQQAQEAKKSNEDDGANVKKGKGMTS